MTTETDLPVIEEKPSGLKLATLFLVALPASVILRAYTLATVWFWFVVPLGVRPIGMIHALALCAVASLFIFRGEMPKADTKPVKDILKPFYINISTSVGALLFGWIYSHYV